MAGEKINEEQVANLLATLRTDVSIDVKVNNINNIKSGIKQNNVPEPCIIPLFEATRISMSSTHGAIVNAGFSTLNHLLTRLSRQEPKYVVKEAGRTLPLVIEKMGDQKEKYRQLAAQCLTTFWKSAALDVERIVKNAGLVGKNSRMKEASMTWIVEMHQENGMPFKSFVSALMDLLEDADGMVRDTARNSVITLFQNAPNAAKSDLKKQLKNFNVRPTIVAAITAHLGAGGPPEYLEPEAEVAPARPAFAKSVSSVSSTRPATPAMEVKVEAVDPSYVNTLRELEDTFRDMHPFFEGKESEGNWLKREQSCTKIRRLNAGNAPSDFHDAFLVCVKGLLDGILKAVNSLRTSLSKEGCSCVQELTRTAGPGIDPMVEILLQNLIKLCGGTKKISSQQGNQTVDIIISHASYNLRILQHIWLACQDKNVQPRTYATGWLKTLLKKEIHHKNHIEHTGGLDLIEKCIKKGLADRDPDVRTNMRSTYWAFSAMWPIKAEAIMDTLDTQQQKLLQNAPDNPKSPKKPEPAAAVRPGLGFSKSMGPPKPSLRETMMAQKKAAMATKTAPARPGSAMAVLSPVRKVSGSSTVSEAPVRTRPEPSTTAPSAHGGMSVAPMRPTKFRSAPRPEPPARPATAGPYSVRRPVNSSANSEARTSPSPTLTRIKTAASSTSSNSPPKRPVIARPNTAHSNHSAHSYTSQGNYTSPARPTVSSINKISVPSPKQPSSPKFIVESHVPPPKFVSSPRPLLNGRKSSSRSFSSSPSKGDEDFTMVVPTITGGMKKPGVATTDGNMSSESDDESPTPMKLTKPMVVYEDPFSSNDENVPPRHNIAAPVLEEVNVNEDAMNLARNGANSFDTMESNGNMDNTPPKTMPMSPERMKQGTRLLDSGITKIRAKSLDVHGFRKLQGMIRDKSMIWSDDKFDILLLGLFEYLESPLASLSPEKVQDVKAQILATIKLMYKKDRDAFRPHVSQGLESLLAARSAYDARSHIVAGLELLADELVMLAEPQQTTDIITAQLQHEEMSREGCRTLSMGLHILRQLLDVKREWAPNEVEVKEMCKLAARCLESSESGVRMDAVSLCVSIHARVGENGFWSALGGVKDDPKSLITYYIVKRQREAAGA